MRKFGSINLRRRAPLEKFSSRLFLKMLSEKKVREKKHLIFDRKRIAGLTNCIFKPKSVCFSSFFALYRTAFLNVPEAFG